MLLNVSFVTLYFTLGYREMVSQKKYSFATDVWSLGALVLTCLTGIPAFEVRYLLAQLTHNSRRSRIMIRLRLGQPTTGACMEHQVLHTECRIVGILRRG